MSNYSSIKIYKNNDKNLIGNILTYDDGWTEGIIVEQNNKKFVFGIFHRTKIIQLYLINIDNPQKVQKFSAIKRI